MAGPWERYQPAAGPKPWERYGQDFVGFEDLAVTAEAEAEAEAAGAGPSAATLAYQGARAGRAQLGGEGFELYRRPLPLEGAGLIDPPPITEGLLTPLLPIRGAFTQGAQVAELARLQPEGRFKRGMEIGAGVVTGAENVVGGAAEFMTSPVGVATLGLGVAPAGVKALASGAFAIDMARHAPESWQKYWEARLAEDPAGQAEAITEGLGNLAFVGLAAKHSVQSARAALSGAPSPAVALARALERSPMDPRPDVAPRPLAAEAPAPGPWDRYQAPAEMDIARRIQDLRGAVEQTSSGSPESRPPTQTITGSNVRMGTEMPVRPEEIPPAGAATGPRAPREARELPEVPGVPEPLEGQPYETAKEPYETAKEPWEMTKAEWEARDKAIWGELSAEGTGLNAARSFHRVTVRDAHAAGLPVPAEVLAEYGLNPTPPAAAASGPRTPRELPEVPGVPEPLEGQPYETGPVPAPETVTARPGLTPEAPKALPAPEAVAEDLDARWGRLSREIAKASRDGKRFRLGTHERVTEYSDPWNVTVGQDGRLRLRQGKGWVHVTGPQIEDIAAQLGLGKEPAGAPLPAPAAVAMGKSLPVALAPDELIVLTATRSLKNTYSGRSNIRFTEANRETGITPERWEAAKATLIQRGLLMKSGGITPEGRTTSGQTQLHQLKPPALPPEALPKEAAAGRAFSSATPVKGTRVKGRFALVELPDLVTSFDPGYEAALQPRDRSRAASANQIAEMVLRFDPYRLGEAPTTDLGAPMVDNLNQVLSGNGRTTALRALYDAGKGDTYKDWLVENAETFGLTPDAVKAMERPTLVRRVTDYGGIDKVEFARQSNQQQILGMGEAEKAAADAKLLAANPQLLEKFRPGEDGNVLAASNREFLNEFIQGTGDQADLLSSQGYNDAALTKRVKNAVLSAFLGTGDQRLLSQVLESAADLGIKKAVDGTMAAAPALIRFKGTAYDLTENIHQAFKDLVKLKSSGEKLAEFLEQSDLIGNPTRTAQSDLLLRFYHGVGSLKEVNETLLAYARQAKEALADAQSGGLFGGEAATRLQILDRIYGTSIEPFQGKAPQPPAEPPKPRGAGPTPPGPQNAPAAQGAQAPPQVAPAAPLKFAEGQKVMVGEGAFAREGVIAASGPTQNGQRSYFVRTNLGEVLYTEADIRPAQSTPAAPAPSRPLSRRESEILSELVLKQRGARERGTEPLTQEELRQYQALTARAGQTDLLAESANANAGRIKSLQEKLAELERMRRRSMDRLYEAVERETKQRLLGEAKVYEAEAAKVRTTLRQLEEQAQSQGGEGDMFGGTSAVGDPLPAAVAMPPLPPGVPGAFHHGAGRMLVALERIVPGQTDVPGVMVALENVMRAAGNMAPIRSGRFYQRARGIYKPDADVVRLDSIDNIPTAAHEVAHAVSDTIFGGTGSLPLMRAVGSRPAIAELRTLGRALYGSRKPVAGYTAEGFSELVRLWLTTEEAARRAPAATAWMEGTLFKAHPDLARAMQAARERIDIWRGQGAMGRAQAQMKDPPGRLARLKELAIKTLGREAQVEEFEPLRVLGDGYSQVSGKRLSVDQDPFLLASAKRGSTGAVMETMVEAGMVDVWGNIRGPGLKEALARVKPAQGRDFATYLWSRRALERWGKGQNPGMALEDAQYLRAKLETPEFIDAASKWYQWWDGVLEYVKQASPGMNRALVDAIRAGSSNYAPLARVLDPGKVKGAAAGRAGGGLYRMHGSGLPIHNIFQQSLLVAEKMIARAHRDMVLESVFRLSREPGMGWLVEEVPRTRVMESVNIEKIRQQLEDSGVDTSAIGPDELLKFATHLDKPSGTDPIMVRQTPTGPKWYQVPAKVFDLLEGLNPARLSPVADLLIGMPNRAFKMGVTGLRASFSLVTNPIRDLPTFMLQSLAGNPGSRAVAYMQSVGDIVRAGLGGKVSPEWQAYKQLGIGSGMFLGGDIQHARREARSLFRGRFYRKIASPVETLREILSFTEAVPRLAEMRLVGKDLGWVPGQPLTPEQAIAMTVAAKRVTTDFSAAGSVGKQWNQVMPFYNATVQGTRGFLRAFKRDQGIKDEPHRALFTVLKGLSLLTLPVLWNWWANKDKEWYQQLPWRERYLYTNVEGPDGEIVQVPRPPEWGQAFMVLPEMLMDSWYRQDPESATQGLAHLFHTQNPLGMPSVLETALQQKGNIIPFFDRPIVPRNQLDLPPGEQRAYYSSELAKALGNAFPNQVSPRRVDAAVRSLFGGVGGDVLDAPGELMKLLGLKDDGQGREFEAADVPIAGRLFRRGGQFSGNNRVLAEFWDEYLRSQSRTQAQRLHQRDGTEAVQPVDAREMAYGKVLNAYHTVIKLELDIAARTANSDARRRLYQSAARTAQQALAAKPKEP